MFKKKYISIILLIILIFSLTGCNKSVDNTGEIIKTIDVKYAVNGQTEHFVIGKYKNYKEVLDNNQKQINYEEFYWESDKIIKLSRDLETAGFYNWNGFKSNNRAMSNALNLKIEAVLSNGNKIKVSAYGDMPSNYQEVIKLLKVHFS